MLTRFPRLLAIDKIGDSDALPQQSFTLACSDTDLLLAWAILLRGYTGLEDEVTFFFDYEVVTVSTGGNASITKEHGLDENSAYELSNATAVYVKKVSS